MQNQEDFPYIYLNVSYIVVLRLVVRLYTCLFNIHLICTYECDDYN